MAFNFAQFLGLVQNANPTHSRFKRSSVDPLLEKLKTLGPRVGPLQIDQIQPLWVNVPHMKQQKYRAAIAYLRQTIPRLADAIPVSPTMEFERFHVAFSYPDRTRSTFPTRFIHRHKLRWKSSNGNMGSLTSVGTRERVTFRTPTTNPPFRSDSKIPMQYIQGGSGSGANIGDCIDDHSVANPVFILRDPVTQGKIIADQVYEYSTDGINFNEIENSKYTLEKGVRIRRGNPVFYFRKKSASRGGRFHFEVEYPIGPLENYPNGAVPVFSSGHAAQKEIRDYGRVVAPGRRG